MVGFESVILILGAKEEVPAILGPTDGEVVGYASVLETLGDTEVLKDGTMLLPESEGKFVGFAVLGDAEGPLEGNILSTSEGTLVGFVESVVAILGD